MSVLLDADDYDELEGAPRWRLLVLEDADELLRAGATRELGQSLSRLLSLGDGRGLNFLVLITTNEPIGRMHPAVARPGRCLADVEFGLLSGAVTEALGGTSTSGVTGGVTLAEVVERRGQLTKIGNRVDDQYL